MRKAPMYERLYDVEGYEQKILLQIFDPQPQKNGWAWGCEYRLEAPWLGWEDKPRWGHGDDKMDAFISALILITIQLRALSRRSGTLVSFRGDEDIDLIDRDFY